jgi:ABC-2 type transport system permease protein
MPGWMSTLAQFNPMTWVINAVRPLLLASWTEALPRIGMVVLVLTAFNAICLYGGVRAFRRALG